MATTTLIYFSHSKCILVSTGFFKGTTKYFIFTVLPFGLSAAASVFTKVVCLLVKFWRFHFIKIACLLDDGLGIEYDFFKACYNLKFVYYTLTAADLIPNFNKSFWTLCQEITWLGIDIDITNTIIKITSDRISSIFNTIEFLTDKNQPENYPNLPVKLFDLDKNRRFALDKNNKWSQFNLKFLCSNSTVNEFSSDWSDKNNLLVPSIFLVLKAIQHS